ncbi:MAG TPA: LapA family protein [Bauldia sp.]|nr:LapA family protein [Bauldia sp.]
MRRFLTYLIVIPIAVVVVALSVANRAPVTFSLDPIGSIAPGWSATGPLYVFLFGAVIVGIIIGGAAAWLRQSRWRHAARAERASNERLRSEIGRLRQQIESTTPALPFPRDRDAA